MRVSTSSNHRAGWAQLWVAATVLVSLDVRMARAQNAPPAAGDVSPTATLEQKVTALSEEVAELKALVHRLQDQLGTTTSAQAPPAVPPAASDAAAPPRTHRCRRA